MPEVCMSGLSGYEPSSPLVTFRNVFRSRCNDLRIFRQFFAHIKDPECYHRVEFFLLANQDGFDCFFINTFSGLVDLEVVFHRELARDLFCVNCRQPFNLLQLASLFVLVRQFGFTCIAPDPRALVATIQVDQLVAHFACRSGAFGDLDCSELESTIGPAHDRRWLDPLERTHGPYPWDQVPSSVCPPCLPHEELGGHEGPPEV